MVPEYIKLTDEVRALFVPKDNPTLVTPENYQRVHDVRKFIDALLLCFVKFFESSSADDDPTNFYMEREWRMLGALKFDLADVRRIIIPGTFAVRFREDLPQYAGQVSFAD
jgi:hypothetical protein